MAPGFAFQARFQAVLASSPLLANIQASQLPDDQLRNAPVFHLYPPFMNSPTISQSLQNELLAKGIPSLSNACGVYDTNDIVYISMSVFTKRKKENNSVVEWGRANKVWMHSDLKNMAYYYVYKFFDNQKN